MLVLTLNSGEEVTLFDQEHNRELGRIKFITPRYPNPNKVPLGFDLPSSILILRNELVEGKEVNGNRKDATNGSRQHS